MYVRKKEVLLMSLFSPPVEHTVTVGSKAFVGKALRDEVLLLLSGVDDK